MQVYVFDNTLDGLLTAVFDSFFRKQQDVTLLAEGEQLPLFAECGKGWKSNCRKMACTWLPSVGCQKSVH